MNLRRLLQQSKALAARFVIAAVICALILLPPAPASAEDGAVSVSLGPAAAENGIAARAGDSPDGLLTGTVAESAYWQTGRERGTSYLYMNVDDGYLYDGGEYDVEVAVTYFEEGSGKFLLQYDSQSSSFKDGQVAAYGDSGTWRTQEFLLTDARFANRTNGADFRISVEGGGIDAAANPDLKVSEVTVRKIPKAPPTDEVGVVLGETPTEEGIAAAPGDGPASGLVTGTLDGKPYWQTNQSVSGTDPGLNILYFYFNVDDDYLFGNADQDVYVTVEYYDEGSGSMVLQYDADSAAFKDAALFAYGDTKRWRTQTFKLGDARFANRTNGSDFRLGVSGAGAPAGNPELRVAKVTVKKTERLNVPADAKVYDTVYPTDDVVIADFAVTDFGAVGDGIADDTQAFRDALSAAGNRGGGVVFAPSGHYKITAELVIPTGVTLRGDWADPDTTGGRTEGTVIDAYPGRGDGSGTSLIGMAPSSGLTNLSVWYPEQSLDDPVPYPWTIEQLSGDSMTVKNVTLVNSYNGIKIGPVWNELHYVKNLRGTALHTGIFLDYTTDIGRLEQLRLSPDAWADSGLAGAPAREALRDYMTENAEGIVMGRSDWEYMSDIHLSGFKTGLRVTTRTNSLETANAQLYKIRVDDSNVALKIEGVNDYGLLVSDSRFEAGAGDEPAAIYAKEGFRTIVQFNNVFVGGDPLNAVVNEGSGILSFENSRIENWRDEEGGYAIAAKGGSLILGQTSFAKADKHVLLQKEFATLQSVNSGSAGELKVENEAEAAEINVHSDDRYALEQPPAVEALDAAVRPRPAGEAMFNAAEPPYGADPTGMAESSEQIRQALNDAAAAGGGTVYLPAGIYRVEQPLVVPEGVELRGSWDVPHHTIGGGTVLFTSFGENDPDGTPFISLEAEAGLRGLSVYYDKQDWNNVKPYSWTVQGQGHGVYLIDATLINPYKAIDFGSYDTSGHYIDYAAGSPLKEGIFLGGGAEGGFLRNVQFNPHYYGRNNYPNHPQTDADFNAVWNYQKENLDAFRIGGVKNETIFNTFVYGSQFGIHFEEQNGLRPEAVVIGHGTDGSKKGAVVDAAGAAGLAFINTELVSLSTSDKVYVVVGPDFDSKASFFNTSMWGDTTRSFDVYAGDVRIQQANFATVGERGINALGGSVQLYDSYFRQPRTTHAYASPDIDKLVLTNNLFSGGLQLVNEAGMKVTGTNLVPVALELSKGTVDEAAPERTNTRLTLTNLTEDRPVSGRIVLLEPEGYAAAAGPIRFEGLALGQSVDVKLPYLSSDSLKYRVTLDSGYAYVSSLRLARSFASREDAADLDSVPDIEVNRPDQYGSVGGRWGGIDDLSARSSLRWDDEKLYVEVTVKDNEHYQAWSGVDIWQGDSLQLGIDLAPQEGSSSRQVSELGFALGSGEGVEQWRWRAPEGMPAGELIGVEASVARDEARRTTVYDIAVPFAALQGPGGAYVPGDPIGFALLLNDNDGMGRTGFVEFNQGIGTSKDATQFGELLLLDGSFGAMLERSAEEAVKEAVRLRTVTAADAAANFVALLPDGETKAGLQARLDALSEGTDPDRPSGGGGGGAGVPQTSEPVLASNGDVIIKPETRLDGETAAAELSEALLAKAFGMARPAEGKPARVIAQLPANARADGYALTVPSRLLADGTDAREIVAETPLGEVTVPAGSLLGIEGERTTILIREPDRGGWSEARLARIGDRPAAEIALLSEGQTRAWSGGPVKVALPYTPTGGEAGAPELLVMMRIGSDGQAIPVASGKYEAGTGRMTFLIREGGSFAVAQAAKSFADLGGYPWAKRAVEALAARGIANGVADSRFDPSSPVKRADFVKLLAGALELRADKSGTFSDVKPGAYYANAVRIAQALCIATGTGDGRFLPDSPLTREEAAAFAERALAVLGERLPAAHPAALDAFADQADVSAYAADSLGRLVQAGLLEGDGGRLRPQERLTRAEAAALLYRIYMR